MTAAVLAALLAFPLAAAPTVKVQVRDRGIVDLPLERYVAAVLAGEAGAFHSREASKAMAVAARTWAVRLRGRHSAQGFDFCETTHCQHFDLKSVNAALDSIVAETSGELLWFEGKPALTPYTANCGGRTEDAGAMWPGSGTPYLRSRPDEYCARTAGSSWQWSAGPREILGVLERAGLHGPHTLDHVAIVQRTASARARTLLLSGGGESVRISAGPFRFAIGRALGWNTLRSDRYEVRASNGRILFEGTGAGHGAGLCQRGAEQMGLAGRSYREILAYYYPGTETGPIGRGLSWQRLGGDTVTLLTTRPEQDRAALAIAERIARTLTQRTGWPMPAGVEIRVYPDLDTFRNATAEPGWVAAHTEGRRIHLQPVAVLRSRGALESTLRHELIHMLVESQAAPGLPMWFREGLAGHLESLGRASVPARAPDEAALRQTNDAARARRAYADAVAAVSGLVRRYGEGAVLGWVQRGLPPEVTNASASQPATKSK